MKKSIRSVLNSSFLYVSIVCAAIAAAGVWASGEWFFGSLYRRAVQESLADAEDRLALFDELVAQAEEESRQKGRMALRSIGGRFRTAAVLESWRPADLKTLAETYGVTDVYFLDQDGRIFATSFGPDLGFNLFNACGEDFVRKLKSLYGSGLVVDQRISQSFKTGIINSYQYYSPEGSNILIETSTRISDAVQSRFPGLGYQGLLQAVLLGTPSRDADGALVRIVDFVGLTGEACWSIFGEGVRRDEFVDLVVRASKEGTALRRVGQKDLMVVTVAFKPRDYDIANTRRFGIIEVNRTPLVRFRFFAAFSFLGASSLAVGVSLWMLKRNAVKTVVERAERLAQAIRRSAKDGDAFRYSDTVGDEISTIANCVSELTGAVDRTTKELSGALLAKDALLHEVHHRVRNNLQFVLSLINLKLSSCSDEESEKMLMVLKNHIFSMALVQEYLHATPELASIELHPYLSELAHHIARESPGSVASVHVDSVVKNAKVTVDQAVPLGIIVAELVTNSMKHAFPSGHTASVRIETALRDGIFSIMVADNGIGKDALQNSQGIGMVIVHALVSQLDGEILIEYQEGMRIRVEFPAAV